MKGEPRRMKTMATIHRIRNEYFAEGKTISEIAREQNIDRKTIRKYINKDDWSVDLPVTREPQSTLFDTYGPIITRWLEEDKTRRRKQRHTAKRVFDRLIHHSHLLIFDRESYRGKHSLMQLTG